MPLPDADPDKRMYKLLKNIDLENLTFAQFQSTAQTVFAEPESEDTLRRIVLINLSRMAVAGQWNGLTTSGGAATSSMILPKDDSGTNNRFIISQSPPWGSADKSTTTNLTVASKPMAFPFIAPKSGDVTEIGVNFTTAAAGINLYVAIYDSDSDGMADSRLTYATISTASTGNVYQTSLTDTATLVAGTQYWYTINLDSTSAAPYLMCGTTENTPGMGLGASASQDGITWFDNAATALAVPAASFTNSYTYGGFERPICSIKIG